MTDQFEIRPPKEGVATLVSQFSHSQIEAMLDRMRESLGTEPTPEAAESYLAATYPDLTERQQKKLALLACDCAVDDDFDDGDLVTVSEPNRLTAELELKVDMECNVGDIVVFRGKYWVLASREQDRLVLKRW